jgi:hypothetical protein
VKVWVGEMGGEIVPWEGWVLTLHMSSRHLHSTR